MSEFIPKNPIKFGIFATKPQRGWAIGALIAVFVATALDRYSVVILKNLTDTVSTSNIDLKTLWFWAIAYPVITFIARNFWRASGFTGMRWFMGFQATAYQSLYEYLSLHSKNYFNNRFAGTLANKISNAVDGVQTLFEKSLWEFIPLLLGLVWYVIFTTASNVWLGLILASWAIIFLLVNAWFAKKMQKYSIRVADSASTLKGRIVDSLSNMSLVHEHSYISGEREYIRKFINKQKEAGLSHWWYSEWVLVTNGVLVFLFMVMMVGSSILLFQNQMISVGVIVMVILISGELSWQFFFIGQEMRDAAKNYGQANEGLDEILKEHLITDSPNAKSLENIKGNIFIDNIAFKYGDSRVFNDFSLEIPAGQKVGLVGKSGAGKTTFVSLLLRHFDIQQGAINIDGKDIREIKLSSLRKAIAFVPQDTSLFHRTVLENVKYSNPVSTEKEVIGAAKLAQAHEFITKLSKGYATLVGERGVKLSGGQRQRIAIARAFLKNAPILILDEATSSLDSESEHAIQESLVELMKGRTVIAIAHRLSTLKNMDRLVIIENGKIVEDGIPEELLRKKDGVFKGMWERQVKGFILDD